MIAVYGMISAIIGDYLLGYNTFSTSSSPDAYMGITVNVVPDWRYAASSILGAIAAALFAVGALELMKVMENKYGLKSFGLYKVFKLANWAAILYFAFIHIGICMLPVVFNAGMAATGDFVTSLDMVFRVVKSIAIPLGGAYVLCDGCVTVAWIGMVVKGKFPVKKIALICNPIIITIIGQLANVIHEGLDSGFESLGWLLIYLVCALKLVDKDEKISQ